MQTPVYTGDEPTKPREGNANYGFIDWSPEITPVTENVTYYAQFEEKQVFEVGDIIEFGSYPQERQGNSRYVNALNSLAGASPTESNNYYWTPIPFPNGNDMETYMWYQDVEYLDKLYRGIYITKYLPNNASENP